MTEYVIRRATEADVAALSRTMRPADVAECAALGLAPEEALSKCSAVSRDTYVGLADGIVVAVFGTYTMPEHPDACFVWLLSSTAADEHKMAFARLSKRFVNSLKGKHKILGNFVDARYEMAVKWIRWLGFTVHPAAPITDSGVPFHWFDMRA